MAHGLYGGGKLNSQFAAHRACVSRVAPEMDHEVLLLLHSAVDNHEQSADLL